MGKSVADILMATSETIEPLPGIVSPAPTTTTGGFVKVYDSVGAALGTTTITGSVPGGATHLRIVARLVASVSNNGGTFLQFNTDTGAHYYDNEQQFRGTTLSTSDDTGTTSIVLGNTGTIPSVTTIDVPFYGDATIAQSLLWDHTYFASLVAGNVYRQQGVGHWNQSAAITSFSLISGGVTTWQAGTWITAYTY